MTRICRTCPREAAPGLTHCESCVRDRFFAKPEPRKPAWVERMEQNAKDFTNVGRAA